MLERCDWIGDDLRIKQDFSPSTSKQRTFQGGGVDNLIDNVTHPKRTRNRLISIAAILLVTAMAFSASGCTSTPNDAQPSSSPQANTENQLLTVKQTGDLLEWENKGTKIQVQICMNNIMKVRYLPKGMEDKHTDVIIDRTWESVNAQMDVTARPIVIKTKQMTVKVDPEKNTLDVYDANDKMMMKQIKVDVDKSDYQFEHASSNDILYGLHGYDAWQSTSEGIVRPYGGIFKGGTQGYPSAPWIWSPSGWGMLVDALTGKAGNSSEKISLNGIPKNYPFTYFIVLGNSYELMGSLSEISGKAPMFPKWAMGFTNSEWGIDEKELKSIVNTYRQKKLPIDNYTLDFDWKAWGEDHYGDFIWNTKNFPDGSSGKLRDDMEKLGVKLTGIWKPRIHFKTEHGQYAKDHGFFVKTKQPYSDYFSGKLTLDIDFTIPDARKWYFDHAKDAFKSGLVGWWNDEADDGTALQFMMMQKALYDGQRSISPLRVWSMNRNFYLGDQRYGYGAWSGDISSSAKAMSEQPTKMLSAVNVGLNKWSMDTGGFQGTPDPETYTRWMQFSALVPVFRVHGTLNQQRQPWVYGEVAEKAVKPMMYWRYEHIPYIYSYERETYDNGIGLVRPLFYEFGKDDKVQNISNEWMFGDHMLAAPVTDEWVSNWPIYLPEGTWYDYFKGTKYEGKQQFLYKVDDKTWQDVPLFIRQGAIIPSQPYMNYVGEKPVPEITLDLFPDTRETSFSYYDDDGATYDYEKGIYFKQNMHLKQEGKTVNFKIDAVEGTFKSELKTYLIKIHGLKGKSVTFGGAAVQNVAVSKDIYGDVTIVKVPAGQEGALELSVE